MMTHQNEKNVICLVVNCLSYNISKFGRKLITGNRDNFNRTKDIMTSSMKITFFELRCKYDDLLSLYRSHGGMELYLQLMLFPNMIEKLGVVHHSEELFGFQKWHVFDQIYIILPIAARADLNFDALARSYDRSRVTANEWKLSIVVLIRNNSVTTKRLVFRLM